MAIVGIDLGTTYCVVAHLDDRGRPVTVPNRDGDILTPSAIYLSGTGQAIVGSPALGQALEDTSKVATMVKRRMGQPDYGRPVAGRDFRPETLSAIILRKLVQDAERELGPVTQAVITVPAYFDDARRKATQNAGRIAGLEVLDLLDEPSAAALAYSLQAVPAGEVASAAPRTVLVYDLGGGTFDVALVKLGRKGGVHALGLLGDVHLGGKDWDEAVVGHVAEVFRQAHGLDPKADPQSLAMLYASAERAKRILSKIDRTSVTVAHAGLQMKVPLTRAEFDSLTAPLLARTRLTVLEVLDEAKTTWAQVSKVLMVGGSTHMPACAAMLRALSGQEPDQSLAVSEVVARGAALHAGMHAARAARAAGRPADDALADIVEINVSAHSLGVEVRVKGDRLNDRLVLKNTQLPAAASRVYYTAKPNQRRVRVRVLQGESKQAEACSLVGECWIDGLPPDLPRGAPIEVSCRVGADGLTEVTAHDQTTHRKVSAVLHRQGGLTDADLATEAAYVAGLEIQ